MAAVEFKAQSRIPTRPLSYENIDQAFNKELIVDYKTGDIYVKDDAGEIHNISASIANTILSSGELSKYLSVTYTGFDGTEKTVTIDKAIVDLVNQIKSQQSVIDEITGKSSGGSTTVIIQPGQVVQDQTHQFVTNTQLTEISNKVSINDVVVTLLASSWIGSAAPYTQSVSCAGAKANMARPTVDINHTDSETYENAMKADDAWCYIYRAKTGDNMITFYASEKPEVDISCVVQLKQTGLSKGTLT